MLANKKFKVSLKYALIFFIAFFVLISSLLVIYLNWNHSIKESRKSIIEIQRIQSKEIQKYLKFNFKNIEKSVSLITELIEHSHIDIENTNQVETILTKIALQEEMISTLSFADINDNYISVFRTNNEKALLFARADNTGELYSDYIDPSKANVNNQVTQGFFASTRIWFTQAIGSTKLEWHPIYEYFSSGNYGMGASKATIKNNIAIGVVAIDYTLNDLSNLLLSLKQGKPGILFLMDRNNKIIASNVKNKKNNINQELFKKVKANNYSMIKEHIENNNNTQIKNGLIIQTSKIFLNEQNQYYLIDVVSEENLLNQISKKATKQMWVTIFIVIATLFILYFVLLFIFKPIQNLEHASKKIYSGEWDISLPKSRFSEISNLSSAYGAMANKIHKSVQTLENKVKERTEKLNQLNIQLNKTIHTDSLTGLNNRRDYNRTMGELWANNVQISLAIIDIDFFKLYNDTYGHVTGDECLKKIGLLFNSFSKNNKTQFYRIGGEEFAIIFSDNTFDKVQLQLKELMEELNLLKIKHQSSKVDQYVTLSIGVIERNSNHSKWEDLYKEADQLLYKAKLNGRNRLCNTQIPI